LWLSELLDRHLLWIRSSKPVAIGDIKTLQFSLGWFFNPTNWTQLFKDTARSFHQKTAIWIIGLLIGLFLIVSRRWACRKLKDIQFWNYSKVVDGVSKTVPISLANISMAIIVVVTTIGIKWANLKWLVAALSVGFGFGLQEIVANFDCGYILTALTNGGQCCLN